MVLRSVWILVVTVVTRSAVGCLLAAGLVALAASAAHAEPLGGTPVAYVSVRGTAQVVGIDLGQGRVIARIRVPPGPAAIASSNDLRQLLVASPSAGKVTLIDAFARTVVKVFSGFGRPSGVAFAPGGDALGHSRYAYVTDERRGRLVVIDLRRLAVVGRVPVAPRPHGLVVGDLIWVTHGTGAPFVTALASNVPTRPRIVARIPAGGAALAIVVEVDSITVDLAYTMGLVGAVDTGTGLRHWRRRVGTGAYGLAADYRGQPLGGQRLLWVTSPRDGTAILLAAARGRRLRTLTGCPGAHGVSRVGAWLAVACSRAGSVAVYDTQTWERTIVPVGRDPEGVAEIVAP